MVALRFDYRDLFRSPRLAFSFQRLWIQFVGLLIGYAGYAVLAYASFLVSGESLGGIWSRYGFLPCAFGMSLPWYGWILFGLGVAFLTVAWLVTATAVSRAAYMNLKGNTFYTWKESFNFALKKKAGAVIATPVAIIAIVFFTGLGGFVVGLLGRIPYVGELGISLFGVVWYAASFFLVFVGLALAVSLLLTPAILATTDDDAFEGIFQSFSILASQPWRLIVYEVLIEVLSILGFLIFAYFAKKAWGVMTTILIWGMGDKFANLSFASTNLVQGWILPAVDWARYGMGDFSSVLLFEHELAANMDLPFLMTVSSVILSAFVLLIGLFVVAFPFATFNVGNTLLFLILKKKKDDENLLERKDKEEETEEEQVEKTDDSAQEEPASKPKRAVARKKAARKTAGRKPPARKRR